MAILSRRLFVAGAAAGLAVSRMPPAFAAGPFVLPPLPYAADANEPSIDALTMTIHHDRHHAAYVANLNNLLQDHPQVAALGVSGMLSRLAELPEGIRAGVRNNAGGHANHTMFWGVMGGKGGNPAGDLAQAIDRDLGGFDKMRAAVERAGLGQFGSGWSMVAVDKAGQLAVLARPNQDSPLMDGRHVLFGNDVWEHAYYLKYQNRRADYLAAWWNVVNWQAVASRYDAARAGTLDL